ncbi:hypothetical protein HY486_00740 [Candidatus Woesearchaeota archaeon]|nr:hypothetical protein [Candidatus Woesearchaeota archaeon]
MASIARAVEEIVRRRPFLQEGLSKAVINYANLAELMKKEIEQETGKTAKNQAITMALRRLSEKLQTGFTDKIRFDKDTDIVLQSELFEITLLKSSTLFKILKSLYDKVNFDQGDFLTITQGVHQATIISNKRYKKQFFSTLKGEKILSEIEGLTSITIKLPPTAINEVGLLFMATRTLAWESIPIVELVSTFTELTIIVREKHLTAGYNAIKQLIKNA